MGKEMQSAKLGNMPILKLILVMSGPSILSMLVQALYNIVDSIFIGMYDPNNGVLALSYALPIQLFVNAFGIGIAVGTGSLISRLLGEGKIKEASNASQTGILLALIISAAFAIIGYFVAEAFIGFYTRTSTDTSADLNKVYEMGTTYLAICMCCSAGFIMECMLNRILQSMGNMIIPMITQIIGAVTNIILDPIFIIVLDLGAPGAAIATVIGQVAAMLVPIFVILKKKGSWDINIFFQKGYKPNKVITKKILQVGIPTIIMNSVSSIMYMVSNIVLNTFQDAVWSFGVYFKLQSFAFMPVFGLNQGCIPIMGYNYGARNKERFVKCYRYCLIASFIYMFIALILFHTIPDKLLLAFTPGSTNRIVVGSECLRICSICFSLAFMSVISIAMFNSIGHGTKAMMISIFRQILILIPLGTILAKYTQLGLLGYWLAFPIAEIITNAVFFPIAIATVKKIFKPFENIDQKIEEVVQA